MKYRIGQPVWVHFDRYGILGWFAGTVANYSVARPGRYLVVVPEIPYTPRAEDSEGYWRPGETGLRPRDEPDSIKREELGDWDLCPWRPERVTVSEEPSR